MEIIQNQVMAIIPARCGSKGVLGKNIRPLAGHPLLAWSIRAAKKTRHISRILVNTDSPEYADIAKCYGAEVPFLRPEEYATDSSLDIDFFLHALGWLLENENGQLPEYLVHLRPTTPLRDPEVMDQAIEIIMADKAATSLCSANEVYPPCKYFKLNDDGTFSALMGEEYLSIPRQECPKAYDANGYIDVLKSEYIMTHKALYGPRRLAYICDNVGDIDDENHFTELENSSRTQLILKKIFTD